MIFDVASGNEQWNYILNLLAKTEISEIVSNGPDEFFAKHNGRYKKLPQKFATNEDYLESIHNHLSPLVSSYSESREADYLFEGHLSYQVDGVPVEARCHIMLPPATYTPRIVIAKRSASLVALETIASRGSMSTEMMNFLLACIKANMTMVFSGSTGAGKTTILEALSKHIPDSYRIGVAEDTPELVLAQPNVAYLHSVPWRPGMNPNDVATLSWVVQQFQRMRTDKIIIGETRGVEFGDFLNAANSGMEGSLTTLHANDPQGCLMKMSRFASKASPNQPLRSTNDEIASTIDIIVQLVKGDGKYRVSHIEEVSRTVSNDDRAKITSGSLYLWDQEADAFFKQENMSDHMRKLFTSRGVDIEQFTTSQRAVRHPAHGLRHGERPSNEPLAPRRIPTAPANMGVVNPQRGQ